MVKSDKLWTSHIEEEKKTVEYKIEAKAIDVALQVFDRLNELNINASELAARLKVSRAYISQILSGKTNMTLKTLLKLADSLGMEAEFRLNSVKSVGKIIYPSMESFKNADQVLEPNVYESEEMGTVFLDRLFEAGENKAEISSRYRIEGATSSGTVCLRTDSAV